VLPVVLLAAVGAVAAAAALYQISFFLRIPADILSFAESPFVTDIIKFREGAPLYLPAGDNNSYPYNPGAQILTYLIASAFGAGTSIPGLRVVQFGYVILASVLAVAATVRLADLVHGGGRPLRPFWAVAWWPLLFLVCLDPEFNKYVHSLHNDGLALLVSVFGFWLAVRHASGPRTWHLLVMAVLPALGFLVKQNQAMWLGLFAIYLVVDGRTPWRRIVGVTAASVALVGAAFAAEYVLWGEPFLFWTINALGDKQVSVLRSVRHLVLAGGYAAMGLAAALAFFRSGYSRTVLALWVVWATMFGIQAYTSGLGFAANHLGPGVVVATAWFLVWVLHVWPTAGAGPMRGLLHQLAACAAVFLVFGALRVIREPISGVPAQTARFISEIEQEFEGMDPRSVLLDNGSWVYLRDGVIMKDRSAPVSLHVGINQPEINRQALEETISRIDARVYRRLLVRMLDTPRTDYDFQDRGSGVKDAMLENYQVVRRIQGVDVGAWWPKGMLGEILVLEPRPAVDAP
jgi:hypothetical protein